MTGENIDIAGRRLLLCPTAGPVISTEQAATDLISEALGDNASMIVLPMARLDPPFFRLASGLAGAITQKCVNYGLQLAIVGDTTAFRNSSKPLRDFIREANWGSHIWLVADMEELERRLQRPSAA